MRLLAIIFALAACAGCINGKPKAATASQPEQSAAVADITPADTSDSPARPVIGRLAFYQAFKSLKDGGYFVSKGSYHFLIHEDGIVFDELSMDYYPLRIKDIRYESDDVIVIELNAISSTYYSEYKKLTRTEREQLKWGDLYIDRYNKIRMVRNPQTMLWTIYLGDDAQEYRRDVIETRDIIPSGYRYTNMATRRHNPERDDYDREPAPLPESIMLSEIPYTTVDTYSEEYYLGDAAKYRPFEGVWLELDEADSGYVVYKRWDESGADRMYIPTTIEFVENAFLYTSYWEDYQHRVNPIKYYDDGTILFSNDIAFRWKDREKGIAYWTTYYSDGRVASDDLYVREDMNTYPVVDYDDGELYLNDFD